MSRQMRNIKSSRREYSSEIVLPIRPRESMITTFFSSNLASDFAVDPVIMRALQKHSLNELHFYYADSTLYPQLIIQGLDAIYGPRKYREYSQSAGSSSTFENLGQCR